MKNWLTFSDTELLFKATAVSDTYFLLENTVLVALCKIVYYKRNPIIDYWYLCWQHLYLVLIIHSGFM